MQKRVLSVYCGISLLVCASLVWARQPILPRQQFPLSLSLRLQSPSGLPAVVERFCKQVNTAETLSFTAQQNYRKDLVSPFSPLCTLAMQVQRPNRFAIHIRPVLSGKPVAKPLHKEFYFGELYADFFCDGKTQIAIDPRTKQYKVAPAPNTISETDLIVLNDVTEPVLNGNLLDRYKLAPEEIVEKKPMYVLESTFVRDGDRSQEKLYFDKTTGELTRQSHSESEPTMNDEMKEHLRVEYNGWKFNIPLPDTTFDVRPPANGKRLTNTP